MFECFPIQNITGLQLFRNPMLSLEIKLVSVVFYFLGLLYILLHIYIYIGTDFTLIDVVTKESYFGLKEFNFW